MMRALFFIVLTVAPMLVGFAAGAATAVIRGWGDRDVHVDVVNESGQRVKSLALNVESCGARNALARGALEPGDRVTFRFMVCGEGVYELRAQLENGTELRGRGDYVERGYRATQRVRRSDIVSTVSAVSY
ncbi:MAG: hypothetical protein JF586_04115 [Burkholderiales bacterium]|jgi:hypothetical protein|nr:hypothetical protein [Burkholderiales bacterium]